MTAVIIIGAIALAAVLLVVRLAWPARRVISVSADPWAQRNDVRMPSLERVPEAADNAVDAAIAAQINGVD
jgi:hypothetical protein